MNQSQPPAPSSNPIGRLGHVSAMASRSESFERRARSDVDSWVDVSSQPSSSSLSSFGDEIVTTGLRVQDDPRAKRRRTTRSGLPTHLNITRTQSVGGTSSQEEYEESESESDRIMTSSGEGPMLAAPFPRLGNVATTHEPQSSASEGSNAQASDDEDENRTAINYPINHAESFTPLPNAFSHPPTGRLRNTSQPAPGSYFPPTRPGLGSRPSTRHSLPLADNRRQSHMPQNPLSPSFNAAAEHEEALRASLSGLLSVAAAARGLQKPDSKRPIQAIPPPRSMRMDPTSFRLMPESALPTVARTQLEEPTFKPTIRRTSTNSTSTTSEQQNEHKRKAAIGPARNSSRDRRLKKARRSASSEDLYVTPTLLTWVVSAGVVVFLSALSFSAGYSLGREAGRLEAGSFAAGDEQLRSCAREAGRSSLGLKRSLARSAIQV